MKYYSHYGEKEFTSMAFYSWNYPKKYIVGLKSFVKSLARLNCWLWLEYIQKYNQFAS